MCSPVCHLCLSTVPFFCLFSYFLYSAYKRPILMAEMNNQEWEEADLYPLMDMLYNFLSMIVLWSILGTYLAIFIKKRRKLMERYVGKFKTGGGVRPTNVTTVIGNVIYEAPTGCRGWMRKLQRKSYAQVIYPHPESYNTSSESTGIAATDEVGDAKALQVETTTHYVTKTVRTYHPYDRENVAILLLPNLPLSGQPKADVERDVATYHSPHALRNKDRLQNVVILCLVWILFSLGGSLYVLHQMSMVNDVQLDYENVRLGWIVIGCVVLVGIPLVAVGGNLLTWWVYARWVTKGGGTIGSMDLPVISPKQNGNSDEEAATSYKCMV